MPCFYRISWDGERAMIRKELRRKVSVYGVFLITFLIYGCGKKEDLSVEGTSDVPVMMEVSEQEELSWYVPDENTKYFLECDGTEEEITFCQCQGRKRGRHVLGKCRSIGKTGVLRDTGYRGSPGAEAEWPFLDV